MIKGNVSRVKMSKRGVWCDSMHVCSWSAAAFLPHKGIIWQGRKMPEVKISKGGGITAGIYIPGLFLSSCRSHRTSTAERENLLRGRVSEVEVPKGRSVGRCDCGWVCSWSVRDPPPVPQHLLPVKYSGDASLHHSPAAAVQQMDWLCH